MKAFGDLPSCEHNPDYECFACCTMRHDATHPQPVDGCLVCKMKTVRIYGRFTGTGSMSDTTQEFWHTGDASVFDRQEAKAEMARRG